MSKDSITDFEKERREQIKRNQELLSQLEIDQAVSDLQVYFTAAARTRPARRKSAKEVPVAPRRSERIRNLETIPDYTDNSARSRGLSKSEVYTKDDLKKLGSYKKGWKLFKDGRDKYGNRIIDTPNSKPCHQCCRIAEGKKTNCHQCKSEKGQLCGDCLFVRYGENLDELDENWICPCCREICNCDICRLEKGLRPTGNIARKVMEQGFLSVAHFLIQTCQKEDEESATEETGEEAESEESSEPDDDFVPERRVTRSRSRRLRVLRRKKAN